MMTMPHLMNCNHSDIGWCLDCVKQMHDELSCWKEAVIDAAVVNWTYTAETEKDPKKAINDLMCYAQQIALDPAVSSEAKHLYDRIKELEDLLLELNDQHELGFLGIEALTRSAERALNKFYDAINQLKDRE